MPNENPPSRLESPHADRLTLLDWLNEKPFVLALSSGFFGFFAHCGAVAALEERGLRAAKVTGASAGALIAGAVASGMNAGEVRRLIFSIKRDDFWDPRPGFGFLRGRKFEALLQRHFAASFAQAQVPLAVSVFDLFRFKTEFINTGCLPSAVLASCAVPLMFHPVRRAGRVLVDGGVFGKSGIAPGDERVLCIYLESPGVSGIYERRTSSPRSQGEQTILRLRGLPQVGPNKLGEGEAAYAAAYTSVKLALDRVRSTQTDYGPGEAV